MEHDWSVRIEAAHNAGQERGLQLIDQVMRSLRNYAAVSSGGPSTLAVQMTVTADSLPSAFAKGIKAFEQAVRNAGAPKTFEIVDVETETDKHFEARVDEPDPELIGIAELANLVNVSRSRASAMAARRDFPAPYARLASGPVWIKANLSRWFEEWQRRPGVNRERATTKSSTAPQPTSSMAAAKSAE